jgi:hypothetical protein
MSQKRIDWEARFYAALVTIAKHYRTSRQVMQQSYRGGLEPAEALEYAYDNLQAEAQAALKGYRAPKKATNAGAASHAPVQTEAAAGDREDPSPAEG